MENAIDLALRHINHSIPVEILEVTFENEKRRLSIEDCIVEDVINNRVLHDCNVVSGKVKKIMLDPSWIKPTKMPYLSTYGTMTSYALYTIPPEERENRPINHVIGIQYPYNFYAGTTMPGGVVGSVSMQDVGSLACQVLDSQSGSASTVMPIPYLVSGHQVKLSPINTIMTMSFNYQLTVRLSYDKDFTNLTQNALIPFRELALTATKAFIWNKLVLKADKFYTTAGHEWGRMKEIVDSYQQSQDEYNEKLHEFKGGSHSLDDDDMYTYIINAI